MSTLVLALADVVAVAVLTFALYLPRHRRRDLPVAFLGVNVGVLAVSMALNQSAASVGLGLGLFGVLSIIRLRSEELAQHEIAYYFSALALGLLGGIGIASIPLAIGLMALVLATMYVGDHPRLVASHHRQVVNLDSAIVDEKELQLRLEQLLGVRVVGVKVQRLDLVNDTTTVDVRFLSTSRVGSRADATVLR